MPLLLPILEALAPLLKRRDTYYLAALLLLALFLWRSQAKLRQDEALIATRPKVETRIDTQIKTVVVEGPERIVERIVAGQVVERDVYREPKTTTVDTNREFNRDTSPACAAPVPNPWRYVGVMADPFAPSKIVGVRGGLTLWNRFDIGLGARFDKQQEQHADVSIRF